MGYTQSKTMDITKEVEQIEKELLELIVVFLKENKMPLERGQQMARDFLALLPMVDQKDLLTKLKQLSDNYTETRELYLKELTKVNELSREEALTQMRNAVAQGNLDHAILVAKKITGGKN